MKRSLLIKPMMDEHYPTVVRGEGIYLYDDQGKKYLDGSSGAVTASLGHALPEIIHASYEQLQKVSFVYRSQFTSEAAEELAHDLNKRLDAKEDYWSFFVNSGSEATETAMKIAIQHYQEQGKATKNKIISRWVSYHGITMGALSMSGHVKRRERFVPLLEDYPCVAAPYCYQCPFQQTFPNCKLACAKDLETAITRIGAQHIAAFIAEPIVGAAGGVIVPPKGYYQEIKRICDQYDILFIADEVMTGLGRSGKMFAIDYWDVKPDIVTLGKGLSAGYTPIAAALASEKVMLPIIRGSKSIMSGHTFSANPQSAAIALAVLNYLEKEKVVENVQRLGEMLLQKLDLLAKQNPIIGDIRGKGLLIGVEFHSKSHGSLTQKMVKTARDKGLLLYPSSAGVDGIEGDGIIIAPPLTIKEKELDELVALFAETLKEFQGG
ncbi:aspartate aminotransferase family protein [Alkalihalobacillus sp. MEB130]|uniref:aspartate aminotransferase family protein n=1 Tax=Alkalihalobacillus sp. MEB130 TaxID=2976704 RepID=UPI0028DD7B17|nr:aspartate aminotransferase family protein [Alkalihalobacillus sp. MEB130]MDT8861161.1 aspartate aminotransferase family protein [Alkalihalobacillus sp. MEB130]